VNEDQTRKDFIDPAMKRAGWKVGEGPGFSSWAEFQIDFPDDTSNYVDYCLMHNGQVIAKPWLMDALISANSCITTSPPRALTVDLLQVYFFLSAFLQVHQMRVA